MGSGWQHVLMGEAKGPPKIFQTTGPISKFQKLFDSPADVNSPNNVRIWLWGHWWRHGSVQSQNFRLFGLDELGEQNIGVNPRRAGAPIVTQPAEGGGGYPPPSNSAPERRRQVESGIRKVVKKPVRKYFSHIFAQVKIVASRRPKLQNNRTAAIVFVSSRRIESYTYTLTTKGQLQNLTSSQGHERPLGDLSSPCCIAFDASRWEKHFGDYPMSLAHIKQKLWAKTYIDLMVSVCHLKWPFKGRIIIYKFASGSSTVT